MKMQMANGKVRMSVRRARVLPCFISRRRFPLLLAFFFTAIACIAFADKLANAVVMGFGPVTLDWHEPPFETKPKTVLNGAEAEPMASSHLIEIRKVQLQILNTNGEVQLVVEAPECVFDMAKREVSSTGTVALRSADGMLRGEGFLWQQTNTVLIISNRVRTDIHVSATNSFFK